MDAWSAGESKKLPLSPSVDRWTEDHYSIYSLVELALGNRKEITREEAAEIEVATKAEQLIESGDPDWLVKVQVLMAESGLEDLEIDEKLFSEINEEQLLRGE